MKSGMVIDNNLYLRCPFCGDSEYHEDKAHFSIRLDKGFYHCFRCNASGKLSLRQYLELATHVEDLPPALWCHRELMTFEDMWNLVEPGSATIRSTRLPRYQLAWDGQWDTFMMRDPYDSEIVGLHLRQRGTKKSMSIGEKGVAWAKDDSQPLISSPDDPIRIVEGPYDAMTDRDVVLFSAISAKGLDWFRGHSVILTPDGDVWQRPDLLRGFLGTLQKLLYSPRLRIDLVGVEVIPNGKDPDEVPVDQRHFIPRHTLLATVASNFTKEKLYA